MSRICAVCDGTNATTVLCSVCRADPANADWRDGNEVLTDQIDSFSSTARVTPWERPVRTPTEKARMILCLLIRDDVPMPRRVRVRVGGVRQYVTQIAPRQLTLREIARLVGCDHAYVLRVLRGAAA